MTWIFLGTVNADLIQPIGDMLNNLVSSELNRCADKAPMQLTFDHAEVWPDVRRARQVVLRPTSVDERITKLGKVLRSGLLEFYFEQSQKEEVRSFKPHLTLLRLERRQEPQKFGRVATTKVKLSDLEELEKSLPVVLNLDKISLIESHMGKNSAYQILQEVPMVFAR
jgi:2'-5' RNA ligase